MGLDLAVGICSDLARHDEEGLRHYRAQFEAVNRALAAAGLPAHREPEDLAEDRVFSCQLWGYSGLHRLRRLAAHLAYGKPLPPPLPRDAEAEDPVTARFYADATATPGLVARLLRRAPAAPLPFRHLMLHSDAEGYYLPADLPDVLFPDPALGVAGAMVGSVPRLAAECRTLAEAIGMPLELDPQDEALWAAADAQDPGAEGWRRYGVEAFSCAGLLRGCEASLATGAALVFC